MHLKEILKKKEIWTLRELTQLTEFATASWCNTKLSKLLSNPRFYKNKKKNTRIKKSCPRNEEIKPISRQLIYTSGSHYWQQTTIIDILRLYTQSTKFHNSIPIFVSKLSFKTISNEIQPLKLSQLRVSCFKSAKSGRLRQKQRAPGPLIGKPITSYDGHIMDF